MALVTSHQGLRFIEKIHRLRPHLKGHVFLFDFERPQNDVVPVQIKSDSLYFNKFNPLGIDSYVNKDGKYTSPNICLNWKRIELNRSEDVPISCTNIQKAGVQNKFDVIGEHRSCKLLSRGLPL